MQKIPLPLLGVIYGEMAEWLKAHAWKACIRLIDVSRVRIPLSPFFVFLNFLTYKIFMALSKLIKSSFIYIVCFVCIFLVSKELLNFNRVYVFEMYGFSHLDNYFEKICDFKKIFQTVNLPDNITASREDSLIYTAPSKLLYNYVNPMVVHRWIAIICYSIFVLSLCIFSLYFTKSYMITFLALAYSALASQFLSYFFEYKLALTSLALMSFIFLYVYFFHDALINGKKIKSHILTFFLPFLLINLGFEVHCVSRPTNLILYGFIFLYLLKTNWKVLLTFIVATVCSVCVFMYCKPDVKFNLGIFTAKGESLVTIREGGKSAGFIEFNELKTNLLDRIKEAHHIFSMPNDNTYISELDIYSGFLDIIIAVALLILLSLFFVRKRNKIYYDAYNESKFFILFTLICIIFTFVPPFFSNTYLRGHRFVNFYISLVFFFVIFLKIVLAKPLSIDSKFTSTFLFLLALGIFYYKANIFVHYDFKNNIDEDARACLQSIKTLEKQGETIERIHDITFCDNGKAPMYYPTFNGILYLSKLACKRTDIHGKVHHIKVQEGQKCECRRGKDNICIYREAPCNMRLERAW